MPRALPTQIRTRPEPARRGARARVVACVWAGLLVFASPQSGAARAAELAAGTEAEAASPMRRIVSLNPSLTAIAIALGAQTRLVGIDDYSARLEPALSKLPRVGGLYSPNLEAVIALQPDVVVLVPSVAQRDFTTRLAALGVRVESFENTHFDDVLENIERMGRMLEAEAQARSRIDAIEAARKRALDVGAAGDAQKVALVIQREPLYVVGQGGFMGEMLVMLGAESVGDVFADPYPRVDVEWFVAAAPDVIVDMSPDAMSAAEFWARYPSLPAVANGRVHALEPGLVSLPGPDLDRALVALATVLHGEAAAREIAGPLVADETANEDAPS